MRTLTFLHTSAAHEPRFSRLAAELDPSIPVRHEVNEALLAEVVSAGGVTPFARERIEQALRTLAAQGAAVIVCTCSTIGGVAEESTVSEGVAVLRIDRAMAEEAVASGRRIIVAAALATSIEPTRALLTEVAARRQQVPRLVHLWCEGAWEWFQRGEQEAYARCVAQRIREHATLEDVVVLAQASMADAAEYLQDSGLSLLSSPRSGVRAAMSQFRAAARA